MKNKSNPVDIRVDAHCSMEGIIPKVEIMEMVQVAAKEIRPELVRWSKLPPRAAKYYDTFAEDDWKDYVVIFYWNYDYESITAFVTPKKEVKGL